ncbi:uncharacterized protein [Typha angustifolia]
MDGKMKGLLKGLRYISQIFDTKEQEMQIGHPTDVKHLAHIGWDNASVEPPSWMNEFRSPPFAGERTQTGAQHKYSSSDLPAPLGSPKRDASSGGSRRHSRRHASAGSLTIGSPSRDSSESSRHGRRHRSSAGIGGSGEPPLPEKSAAAKQSRRRRVKESASSSVGGGSMRSSRSRPMASLSDPATEDPRGDSMPPLTPTREAHGF